MREEGARKTALRHSALLIRNANPKPVICGECMCASALSSCSSEMLRHGKRIPTPKRCVWVQTKLATTSGNVILGRQVIMCLKRRREKTEKGKMEHDGTYKQEPEATGRTSSHSNIISSVRRMNSSTVSSS